MNRRILILPMLAVLFWTGNLYGAGTSAQPAKTSPGPTASVPAAGAVGDPSMYNTSVPYTGLTQPLPCFGRGLVNVVTCWLEIPRCVVYDNAALPGVGILLGIPEGGFFTIARAGSGVTDLATFGLVGDTIHGNNFPDFITESRWFPPKTKP